MGVSRAIARNTVFNFMATSSDGVINLMVGIALARGLGTQEYGRYAFLWWFLLFVATIINLGVGPMARRFIAEAQGRRSRDETTQLVGMALAVRCTTALLTSLVIIALAGYWERAFGGPGDRLLYVLIAIGLVAHVVNNTLIAIFAGFQRYEYAAYISLGTNPLRLCLVVVLMILGFGIQPVLLLNLATLFLGTFIGVLLLSRLVPLHRLLTLGFLKAHVRNRALKYSVTMTGILWVNYFLWGQAAVLFLGLYRLVEGVGFYRLGTILPFMVMTIIPMVFGAVLLPAISEQFGKGDMDRLRKIYVTSARYVVMLSLPLAAGGMALARPIIHILYGTDYAPVVIIMQIVFVPFAVSAISQTATAVIFGMNQPSFVLKTGIPLVGISIGLYLWLIPIYGVVGAAIGSSVPRLLTLPLYASFASRKTGVVWPLAHTARVALASLLMGLAVFLFQGWLSPVLGLLLGVPLGVALFGVLVVALQGLQRQDLDMLKGMRDSLPSPLRKNYASVIGLAERLLGARTTG